MLTFQGKDGELRIYDHGTVGATKYLEILFSEMDFTGPLSRKRPEERVIMDRGLLDSNTHYVLGDDMPILEPLSISFSCKLADTEHQEQILEWVSGVTKLGGTTQLYSCKGKTLITNGVGSGISTPAFVDNTSKYAYYLECLWGSNTASSGSSTGVKYNEVHFKLGECTITESGDNVIMNINADLYGDVTHIMSKFTSNAGGFTSAV